MSGITDVLLKCSEEDQTDMRLVGPQMREYTMSTCYFLGQRPKLELQIVSLKSPPPAAATGGSAKGIKIDGAVVKPFMLVPETAQQRITGKRSLEEMQRDLPVSHGSAVTHGPAGTDGPAGADEDANATPSPNDAAAVAQGWGEEGLETESKLILSYSPYHRAKSKMNSKRRAAIAALGLDSRHLAPSVCYSLVMPPMPGKFDVSMSEKLGVPKGPLRGKLVKGETVTLDDGTEVSPHQCVSSSLPGGTVLIIDCPTQEHAACLLRHKVFWDLVTPAGKAGPLCVVHMSPSQVLSSPDYAAWAHRFPASTPAPSEKSQKKKGGLGGDPGGAPTVHIVCSPDLRSVDRPMYVASERYLRLLHGLDASLFPLSQGAYTVLQNEVPGLYSTNSKATGVGVVIEAPPRTVTGAPRNLNAVAGWPLLAFLLPPHRQVGLKTDVPETARQHYYCLKGCVCTETARSEIYSQLAPIGSPPPQAAMPSSAEASAQADGAGKEGVGKMGASVGPSMEDVVFFGTGAAAPFKYRTVSAIFLRLSHAASAAPHHPVAHASHASAAAGGGVLLDAGDGTYGAMVRKMGSEGADAAILSLKMLFISHKHADHISGAANILTRRAVLLHEQARSPQSVGALKMSSPKMASSNKTPRGWTEVSSEASTEARSLQVVECAVCGQRFDSEASIHIHQRATHPRFIRPPLRGVHDGQCAAGAGDGGSTDTGLVVVGPVWLESWLRDLGALEALHYRFVDCQELLGNSQSGTRDRLQLQLGLRITTVLVQHS